MKKPIKINNPVYVIPGSTRVRIKLVKNLGNIFCSWPYRKKFGIPNAEDVLLIKRITEKYVYLSEDGISEHYRIKRFNLNENNFEFDPLPKPGTYCYGLFHSGSRKTYPFLRDGISLVYIGPGEFDHHILSWVNPKTHIPVFIQGVHDDRIRCPLTSEEDNTEFLDLEDGTRISISPIVAQEKEILKEYCSSSYFD